MTSNEQLMAAAIAGDVKGCIQAKNNGADDFNGMMLYGASVNNIIICLLGYKWGNPNQTSICALFQLAIFNNNVALCKLVHEWNNKNKDILKKYRILAKTPEMIELFDKLLGESLDDKTAEKFVRLNKLQASFEDELPFITKDEIRDKSQTHIDAITAIMDEYK